MTDESTEAFNWGPLPESWWHAKGALLGAEERHIRFAAAVYRGASQTTAARQAGYSDGGHGDDTGPLRSAGSRAKNNRRVRQLLSMAATEQSGDADGEITPEERRERLSDLARNADPRIQIEAMKYLDALDQREFEQQRTTPANPEAVLRKIHDSDPVVAVYLARRCGISFAWFDKNVDMSPIDKIEAEIAGGASAEEQGAAA